MLIQMTEYGAYDEASVYTQDFIREFYEHANYRGNILVPTSDIINQNLCKISQQACGSSWRSTSRRTSGPGGTSPGPRPSRSASRRSRGTTTACSRRAGRCVLVRSKKDCIMCGLRPYRALLCARSTDSLIIHPSLKINPGEPRVYDVLENIYSELNDLLSFESFHLGGDEVKRKTMHDSCRRSCIIDLLRAAVEKL